MPGSNDRPPSRDVAKAAEEWKLENSSLWWLSLDFFQHPGNILLISSLPFCMGAYYGYRKPGPNLEEWVGDAPKEPTMIPDRKKPQNLAARRAVEKEAEIMVSRQLGFQVASRALGLATLGTVGTFGILGAVGFYASGCKSIEEAMRRTRRWASGKTESLEDWMGVQDRESKSHPEVVATKDMTEEEELNYVYNRLVKEIEEDKSTKK